MKKNVLDILKTYDVELEKINNVENSMINIPIYIINLNTDIYRRNYMKFIMKKMGLNYTLLIVSKVDSSIRSKFGDWDPKKKLNNGEIGCSLSQLWCINYAIKNKDKHFIILEDDVIFHRDFVKLFLKINYKKFDILQLGSCDFFLSTNIRTLDSEKNVYFPTMNALGSHANLYNAEFAKIFFEQKISEFTSFDKDYDMFYEKYVIGVCYPNLLIAELSTTNIEHNFSIFNSNKNSYYVRNCFKNLDYNDYLFIWIVFIEFSYKKYKESNNIINSYEEVVEKFSLEHRTDEVYIKNILLQNTFTAEDLFSIFKLIDCDKYNNINQKQNNIDNTNDNTSATSNNTTL